MFDMEDIVSKPSEQELIVNIYNLYKDCKELIIKCEELLPQMKLFVAPLLEHRDAFDHVMLALHNKEQRGYVDIDNLKSAYGHETRAFFDIADYAFIKTREYINKALKRVSNRKINKVWPEYKSIKAQVYNWSMKIAEIRSQRTATTESVERYKEEIIPSIFSILEDFIKNIEPKLRKK